jgi:hypothetical protein
VSHCGRICIDKRKISLSHVFASQQDGIHESEEKIWLVSFMPVRPSGSSTTRQAGSTSSAQTIRSMQKCYPGPSNERPAGALHETPFPMSWDRSIFHLRRPLANRDGTDDPFA